MCYQFASLDTYSILYFDFSSFFVSMKDKDSKKSNNNNKNKICK